MLRLKLVFALLVVSAPKWHSPNPARVLYPMFIRQDIGELRARNFGKRRSPTGDRQLSSRACRCGAGQSASVWAAAGGCQTQFELSLVSRLGATRGAEGGVSECLNHACRRLLVSGLNLNSDLRRSHAPTIIPFSANWRNWSGGSGPNQPAPARRRVSQIA